MDETLAYYGGAVKALGGGKIAGYGILFTAEPDLEGDRFTKETNLELEVGDRRAIYYRHGTHPVIKDRRLGKATLSMIDEAGAFFEGELNLRDEYERYIYKLAELGKLGWSTGSMPHLVRKELKINGEKQFREVTSWPVGEISLTPSPVEPRTSAFPVKSLEPGEVDDLDVMIKTEEEKELEPEILSMDGLPGLKALCEAVSPANLTMNEHSSIADAALKELLTHGSIFVDAFKGYRVRADRLVEFRFKKDGGHISQAKEESLKSWRDGLSRLRKDIESVETDIDGTLKLSEISRSDMEAAEKHAKFLTQQIANLRSITEKE